MVIDDPFDLNLGMFAPYEELLFIFTEYIWLTDEVLPEFFTPAGLLNSKVEIGGTELAGLEGGPELSYLANTVKRTGL